MQRTRFLAAVLALATLPAAAADKPRKAAPPLEAQKYAMHETHEAEHVTIAAEPCDLKSLLPPFRLDYLAHNILPIRVIVTNNSDEDLTLDDARIHFLAADNSSLNAATNEDLNRALFTLKGATGTHHTIPLGPIGIPITTGKKDIDKNVLADDADFSFATTTVKPHTTVAGYLFYDMSGLDAPVLAHATLELRKVRFAASNRALDTFEIPLHPTGEKEEEKK